MNLPACAFLMVSSAAFAACSAAQPATVPPSASGKVVVALAKSWMIPRARHQDLLYAASPVSNDVDVYTMGGTQVGELTGFDEPTGLCVDGHGDVYIANTGSGTLVEYAHGGTTAINAYEPGASLMGCSVDAKGDVAATLYQPGAVVVYAGGNANDGTTYQDLSCPVQSTMGYDDKGNLLGVVSSTKNYVTLCALMAGATSETVLTLDGVQMHHPGSSMWDGKYMALTDQMLDGQFETGIIRSPCRDQASSRMENGASRVRVATRVWPIRSSSEGRTRRSIMRRERCWPETADAAAVIVSVFGITRKEGRISRITPSQMRCTVKR